MYLVEKMHRDCFQAKTSTTHMLYFLKPVEREIVFVMWIKICRTMLTLTRQQILKICKLGKDVQLRCYILCYYIL